MTDRLTEIHEKKRLIKEKIELIEGTQSRDVDSQ